ncbi:unnamed protein product, partial [Nesidiocoris tenuis]
VGVQVQNNDWRTSSAGNSSGYSDPERNNGKSFSIVFHRFCVPATRRTSWHWVNGLVFSRSDNHPGFPTVGE